MNEQHEKEVEDIRSSDMTPAMMEQASRPKKTWFFERFREGDKGHMIFPCEEREAWEIVYNNSTWKLSKNNFRLLGTSDGSTYQRIVRESLSKAREIEPIIVKKKEEMSKYMRAEENLIMNEVVDMEGDPSDATNEENKKKVLRLRAIIDRLHEELDKLEEEFRHISSDIVKRATAEELEVAKKNQAARIEQGLGLDWPDPDANIITPDVDDRGRNKILSIMSGRRN